MQGHMNIKFVKIALAIIKLFCRGVLRKYFVLVVYTICLLVMLLYGPGLYTGVVVIVFVLNFRNPGYEL
jgi:hypothetical protein